MSTDVKIYSISDNNLQKLLQIMVSSDCKLVAPVRSGESIRFCEITDPVSICTDYIQTSMSAKHLVFPPKETLFGYQKKPNEITISDFKYDTIPDVILWGTRPCDAAGFASLSAVFNWDIRDEIFNKRLEKLTIISLSCTNHDEYCFCTSVNGGPGNTAGSDILITPMGNGENRAEMITKKGIDLLGKYEGLFESRKPQGEKETRLTKIDRRPDASDIKNRIENLFENEIWKQQSERCLGCGACAYVCPACACFDIQDEKHGNSGSRMRCWDSCGYRLFTLHTSGHNPRQTQDQRWRQRIMHKFSYMPDRLNVLGCTGCGRCSRACPVDMNLIEHLSSLMEITHEQQ
jgi:sulfhydrogenase subunit beta (sulfur reductase)